MRVYSEDEEMQREWKTQDTSSMEKQEDWIYAQV